MNEAKLLALLTKREYYLKYKAVLREFSVLPETWAMLEEMGEYFNEYPQDKEIDKDKFISWSRAYKPTRKGDRRNAHEAMVEVMCSQGHDPSIMKRVIELQAALEIQEAANDIVMRGNTGKMDDITRLVSEFQRVQSQVNEDDPFAPFDLDRMFTALVRDGGYKWRMTELNKSIGPVCGGDFIVIAKRPEVGGTTFVTSEVSYMIPQMRDGANIAVFANEEPDDRMHGRFCQSALGLTGLDMAADIEGTKKEWAKYLGNRNLRVFHKGDMTTAWCESVLKREDKWDLIVFNVLWKVRPHGRNLEDHQMYQRVAQWARNLATDYNCPVMAVWQADFSAEGVEYLSQAQLHGSKTGVQGEADVMLMIGATPQPAKEYERYINVVKNKVPSSKTTDPRQRHGKYIVDIDIERGRFNGRLV